MSRLSKITKFGDRLLISLLLLLTVLVVGFGAPPLIARLGATRTTHAKLPPPQFPAHLIGGFDIYGPGDARNAAAAGVQTVVNYRAAYPTNSAMGRVLGSTLHMTQVEAQPWELLHQYECHRLAQLGYLQSGYCAQDYPNMTLATVLAGVKSDMLALRENNQVVGVWALDDWPTADDGGAAAILPQIAAIVHHDAPGVKVICGFGADLAPNHIDSLNVRFFDNYTPKGCDVVALYVYSSSVPDPTLSPTTFDWSMRTLLPKIRAALSSRGWNPLTTPLIGIPQAFGGARMDQPGLYEITPTASEIATQSASFCAGGASGVAYYAWASSAIGNLQTAATNATIADGVREGIARCKQTWKIH
jgi:hypothetical protein